MGVCTADCVITSLYIVHHGWTDVFVALKSLSVFGFCFCFIDTGMYDAYVIYQMECLDKATENILVQFITNILPSVLEEKCGYRLYIQGRDDMPGEGRHHRV